MPTGAEGFTITSQDTIILKGYLEDFQQANTETRTKILEKVMGELYSLRPPNSAFDKKEAKKVCFLKCIYGYAHRQSTSPETQDVVLQSL
jgi:hypothetical protein